MSSTATYITTNPETGQVVRLGLANFRLIDALANRWGSEVQVEHTDTYADGTVAVWVGSVDSV